MKQNTIPAPLGARLSRTEGQATVEDVLSGFWLYVIRQMGERLDGALWAQRQLQSAAEALSLSADIAPLGAGVAEPMQVQSFQECAMDMEEMLRQVEDLGALLRRAVRGCEDARGDFKLSNDVARAHLYAFLREDEEAWAIFGSGGYDWALLERQARAKRRA